MSYNYEILYPVFGYNQTDGTPLSSNERIKDGI